MEKIWLSKYPKGIPSEVDLTQYQSITDAYNESITKYADLTSFSNMGVQLSFSELDVLVKKMASFMQNELKLVKGDRVAIQIPNLLQFPVIAFAALRSGLIIVNTNPLYTAKEMQHQFKDSGAKAIFILANYAHLLESVLKQTDIESIVVTEVGDLFPTPKRLLVNNVIKYIKKMVPPYNLPHAYSFRQCLEIGALKDSMLIQTTQEDIAFLQYTGGTTGVSKGAILTHRNILANMLQLCSWMSPKLEYGKEVAITALPLYHIFSLTVNCLAFMRYGAENVLITNPRDIKAFLKELSQRKFTVMTGVNTLFNSMMNHPDFSKVNFKYLKVSVAGAMALQRSVAERWTEMTRSLVVEGYGLTEASPVVCCNPIDGTEKIGTIGLPMPGTEVKLLDDNDDEVALGDSGELLCRGPQVMRGYWNRQDETIKVMKDDWLRTGDIASVDSEGFFKIVDRKKDMMIVSGFNVYPNEVEEAIASHPGVLEVAAVGIPDEKTGEAIKVFIVRKDPALNEQQVIAHAKISLTNYKVPKSVEFKIELPKTTVGKILRRALRE